MNTENVLQKLLYHAPIRPVLLHTRYGLPEQATSDIDVAIHPAYVKYLVTKIKERDVKVVQFIKHESTCMYYVFWENEKIDIKFVILDMAIDYRWKGCVFYNYKELFDRAVAHPKGMLVLPPELEFCYYLLKKIGKGQLDDRHACHLSRLYRQAPEACLRELRRFFPESAARQIVRAASAGDWRAVQDALPQLRRRLQRYLWRRHPLRVGRYYLAELRRVAERLRQPTGLVVAFLGLDGSGKSTVIREVAAALAPVFRRTSPIHLRPGTQRRSGGTVMPPPYEQPPRGWLAATLKLLYWALSYGWGWICQVWPQKVAATLVLFDRYYDDLLVDPRRYRFAGPWCLARWLQRWIPRPDLYILLDVPAEVACRRKGEVTRAEAQRLRAAYRALAARLPNCRVVAADRPLDEVVATVCRLLLDFLEERTRRRLGSRR